MCDRSNSPARSRTARCSSRIPRYCTGISQPAKSISRAPSATWRSRSGVSCSAGAASVIAVAASDATERGFRGGPAVRSGGPDGRPGIDDLGRLRDERPLGLERQQVTGLIEADPAHLVELVVVAGQVAPGRLHEEIVDGL